MAHCPILPHQLADILKRIADETISNFGAKEVFRTMWESQHSHAKLVAPSLTLMADIIAETSFPSVDDIIKAKGLKQVSDVGALEKMLDEIIAANADKVAEYRAGKDKLFGFFVGLAMKASKGKANPAQMNEILKKKLAG